MTDNPRFENFDGWADWLIELARRYPSSLTATEIIQSEMLQHIQAAKNAVPASGTLWESAAFFGYGVAASVRILGEGVIQDYQQFRQIVSALWGWNVRPYIPALFSAAIMHPYLERKYAEKLMGTMKLYDLRIIDSDI